MAEALNDRLKALLKTRGLTQRALADMAGVTESSVSHYLKGDRVPNSDTLMKLADALATTPDYILRGEPINETTVEVIIDTAIERIKQYARFLSYAQKLEIMEALVTNEDDIN